MIPQERSLDSLEIDWPTVISAGGSALAGALGTGFLLKLLIARYISDNDTKHKESKGAIRELSKNVSEMNTELKVVSSKIGDVMAFRDKLNEHEKNLAVAAVTREKIEKDVNAAHTCIRHVKERVSEHDAKFYLIDKKEGTYNE